MGSIKEKINRRTPIIKRERRQRTKKDELLPKTSLQMKAVKPLTNNQRYTFERFRDGQNLFLHGTAGTGKTFLAVFLALEELSSGSYNKVIIVRSAVPSRDIGFLPGNVKEKAKEYEAPYISIMTELFGRGDSWCLLKSKNYVDFTITSYVRGQTFPENSIIIFDEIQNMTYDEIYTCLTRVGKNSRVIICGDRKQSDKGGGGPKAVWKLLNITERMQSFSHIDFTEQDIVRSGFVKEFLLAVNAEEKEEKKQREAARDSVDYIRDSSHRKIIYGNGTEALFRP